MFAPCELPLSMDPQVEFRPHDRRWVTVQNSGHQPTMLWS